MAYMYVYRSMQVGPLMISSKTHDYRIRFLTPSLYLEFIFDWLIYHLFFFLLVSWKNIRIKETHVQEYLIWS